MKDIKLLWPEAAVQLARSPQIVQYEPMMVKLTFRSAIDDITSFTINNKPVEEYVLAKDRMSVTAFPPDGDLPETVAISGRPRNLDGAMGRLSLRGPQAVVGGEKLLQQIVRLSRTGRGDILGRPELYGKPDFRNVRVEDLGPIVTASFYRISQLIMSNQRQKKNLPNSEVLLGIDVVNTTTMVTGDIRATIRVRTGGGSIMRTLSWEGVQ